MKKIIFTFVLVLVSMFCYSQTVDTLYCPNKINATMNYFHGDKTSISYTSNVTKWPTIENTSNPLIIVEYTDINKTSAKVTVATIRYNSVWPVMLKGNKQIYNIQETEKCIIFKNNDDCIVYDKKDHGYFIVRNLSNYIL